MNFFSHQETARKKTRYLIFVFGLAVAIIAFMVYLSVILMVRYGQKSSESINRADLFQPDLAVITLLGVVVVVGAGCLFKLKMLSGGGAAVAESMGGKLLLRGNNGYKEQMLLNVVEEMAIAAGTPVPQVYILADRSINAFAAGWTPEQAVVGITSGAINAFNREELQGVIAHEFSHILNGDMRLNIRLVGLVFGISCLALLGRAMLRSTPMRRKGKGNSLPLIGVVLMIVGYVGSVAGHMIRASVSRQREFLADASAVQFTRNPNGISSALKMILENKHGSKITTADTEEVEHMLFAESTLNFLFATHPPLDERIRRIGAHRSEYIDKPSAQSGSDFISSLANTESASRVLSEVPTYIKQEVASPYGARLFIFAIVFSDMSLEFRDSELKKFSEEDRKEIMHCLEDFRPEQMLVEVELAIPALQALSQAKRNAFLSQLYALITIDQRVSIRELALFALLKHSLLEAWDKSSSPTDEDLKLVLYVLSLSGNMRTGDAYKAGLKQVGLDEGQTPGYSVKTFLAAIERIGRAPLGARINFIKACEVIVKHDGRCSVTEAELLRVVSLAVGCPIALGAFQVS